MAKSAFAQSGTLAFLVAISILLPAQAPAPEPVTDQETQLGQAVYEQLKSKAEIIESSPLYDRLKPIADGISRVAQPRYDHPFKFILVHEAQSERSGPIDGRSSMLRASCWTS
jgi:hypothetical protein